MSKSTDSQITREVSSLTFLNLVASVFAGFLVINLFKILFQPLFVGGSICGTLLRPIFDEVDEPAWIFNTSPVVLDMDLSCPRGIYLAWSELFATMLALALSILFVIFSKRIFGSSAKPTQERADA